MYRLSHALILALAAFFVIGCEAFDRPESLPSYIAVRNPLVERDSNTHFRSSVGLRNVWIYYAGELAGVLRTDSDSLQVIPVVDNGRTDVAIDGGIFESGQSAFNISYPFWEPVNYTVTLGAMDTIFLEPVFEYIEPRFYDLMMNEGFEGGAVDFEPFSSGFNVDSTFIQVRYNANAFQGSGYAYIPFGAGNRYFEAITANPFRLIRGRGCYAEITYRNSMAFSVGLLAQNGAGLRTYEILAVSPSDTWNTIYVNLISQVRSIINSGGEDTDFWLWIRADGNDQEGYIELDDVRVLQMRS